MSERTVLSFENVKVPCKNCSLVSLCLPLGLTPDDVEKLAHVVKRSPPLHRGDYLFREGDRFNSLYVVKTGSVKTFNSGEDGSEHVLGFHLPGEIIGLDAIVRRQHRCSAKILDTSVACEIPFDRLEEISYSMPNLQHQMYRLLSMQIGHDTEMLMLLGKKNAEERLASFLVNLSKRLKKRGLSATDFYLSMSRHEIGTYLGLAVETVSRLFTRFQEEGLLHVERKHVQLIDISKLESMVNGPGNFYPVVSI